MRKNDFPENIFQRLARMEKSQRRKITNGHLCRIPAKFAIIWVGQIPANVVGIRPLVLDSS
jgi:hypothetical protein